jgi:hypothetical protein
MALFGVLLATSCRQAPQFPSPAQSDEGWHEFQGTWTATGARTAMPMGSGRRAAIANYEGSLVLRGPSRPAVGFRAEAVVLNDSATGVLGRAVWTDEHGDQVYSELLGEAGAANNKITGTFVGGTGRYSGASGSYEFSWQFLMETEDGVVQGQSMGLHGSVRVAAPSEKPSTGGPRS